MFHFLQNTVISHILIVQCSLIKIVMNINNLQKSQKKKQLISQFKCCYLHLNFIYTKTDIVNLWNLTFYFQINSSYRLN